MYDNVIRVTSHGTDYWMGFTGEHEQYLYEGGRQDVTYVDIAMDEEFEVIYDNGWYTERDVGDLERGKYFTQEDLQDMEAYASDYWKRQ